MNYFCHFLLSPGASGGIQTFLLRIKCPVFYHCATRIKHASYRISYKQHANFSWGHIFNHVRPFYQWVVSDLDRSMHRSLLVYVTHSLFIEGTHTTKNTASELLTNFLQLPCKPHENFVRIFMNLVWTSKWLTIKS